MADSKAFLDYSQLSLWDKCQLAWTERYLNQIQRQPKPSTKSSPLTLGTLVHAALQVYRQHGVVDIPEEAIDSSEAPHETVQWAQKLVTAYVQVFPQEPAQRLQHCEEPLRFPLQSHVDGLAKVDNYFHLEEVTKVPNGLGEELTLLPGWWIREYKTKDAGKAQGNYIQSWRMNRQIDFQMLALRAKIGQDVRGTLIDVIEKPSEYRPKRTCKACKAQYELSAYQPSAAYDLIGGKPGSYFNCPGCGYTQKVDTVDRSKADRSVQCYRITTTRTAEQLSLTLIEASIVAEQMQAIREKRSIPVRATERVCVDSIFGPCEYFNPHAEGVGATGFSGFISLDALAYVREEGDEQE